MIKYLKEKSTYIVLALLLSFYVEMIIERKELFITGQYTGLLNNTFQAGMLFVLIPAFIVILGVLLLIEKYKSIFEFLHKYRFAIGALVIIICTVLELSGSSIGYWHEYLSGSFSSRKEMVDWGILAGFPRGRSDELGVFTAFNLSQEFNGYKSVSELIRGSATDVTTVYGSPCFALVTLFRPFFWGYLLLGSAKGLAFYWSARLVCLLLVSYEFCRLVTKDNRIISVTFALMVTFSQSIQWWFSVNGLVEMFIFGELGVLLVHKLFNTENLFKKILICLGIVECAGGYAFTYYPAQQIPLVYVFSVLLVWVFISNRKSIKKQDIILLVCSLMVFAALAAVTVYNSLETFELIMNTVYPGKRAETGGTMEIGQLFYWIVSIFSPLDENGIGGMAGGNKCEAACFYSLFPICIILSLIYMIREKKADFLLIAFICIEVLFVWFSVFGLPLPIAKLTLLSNTIPNRVISIMGFMDLIIFSRLMGENSFQKDYAGHIKVFGLAGIVLLSIAAIYYLHTLECTTNKALWILIIVSVCFVLYLLFFGADYKKLCCVLAVLTLISGICINPVQKGIDVVTDDPLIEAIRDITEDEPDSVWITTETLLNNFPLMAGAKTINSVNVYPNIDLWKKVDPNQNFVDIYNRYAHIIIWFTSDVTVFQLSQPDCFKVYLNVDELDTLGVNYVVSLSYYESDKLKMVYSGLQYYIYKVK